MLYTCGTELTFKWHVMSSAIGSHIVAFFLQKGAKTMDVYIYSDESGVFDYVHNDYFVFAC